MPFKRLYNRIKNAPKRWKKRDEERKNREKLKGKVNKNDALRKGYIEREEQEWGPGGQPSVSEQIRRTKKNNKKNDSGSIEREEQEWGPDGQPSASEQLKKSKLRLTKEERLKHQFIAKNEKKKIDESKKKPKYKHVSQEELDAKVKEMSKPKKKMHPIEKRNRARFGDAHVDRLKAKQVDFKKMKKGGLSKADFIKKYPKSITAQRSKGLRK